MKKYKNLLSVLRTATAASALALALGAAMAQGPIPGAPGIPRVDPPSLRPDKPGSDKPGGGIGITIDLGSIFNAIRNATRKDQPDKEDPKKPPLLQKSAVSITSGSSGNYTIDWVVQYANNTGATLPNVLIKDGPIATIIPGSLQPPPIGWTATTNALPVPDTFALWTGTNIAPHGVMTATFPPPLAASMTLGGSGDGYQPIPYTRLSVPAGQRIYYMNHHEAPGAKLFKCLDLSTGLVCAGWGLHKTLPAGDSSANNSGTMSNSSEYTIDNGKMYYASQGPSGIGIGCYNLETDTKCGFTYFGAKTPGLHINGPWRIGNELYVADTRGALYCANLGGLVPCVGSNYKIPATTIKIRTPTVLSDNWNGGYLAGKVIANKVYITSVEGGIKYTNCFDSTTKTACWNTGAPNIGTAPYSFAFGTDQYNVSNFLYYNVSGAAVAVCTMRKTSTPPAPSNQLCVDALTGAQTSLPTVLPGLSLGAGLETYVAGKTYFVTSLAQADSSRVNAYCWNWSTQAACTTAPLGIIANSPSGGVQNYGSNSDEQGCIYIFGHAGALWHFNSNNIDAMTGLAKPCGGGAKFIKVFQPLQYCSGPKPFRWTSVEVKGAPLANYSKFIVKVLDSINNTVLFTKDLKATGQLQANITGIDAQTISMPLKIEIDYTPNPGMGTSDQPYLEVRYNAPPTEFCFKSTHTCEQKKITNIVETPDPATPGKFISVTVNVENPKDCKTPPPAVCGDPGQPPCPDTVCIPGTPGCPNTACIPGTPGCPNTACIPGTPGCPNTACIPGTPDCPGIFGCVPGTPGCTPVRPPPKPVCLAGDCPDKPPQSIAEEFKEPKVVCARKTKPVENTPKKVVVKPKPAMVAAAPADPNASPKPKPKPRPKPAVKPAARDDDC